MSAYEMRTSVHKQFEGYVKEYLERQNAEVYDFTVYNNTNDHSNTVKVLVSRTSPTVMDTRFRADYLVMKGDNSFYLDLKCGNYDDTACIEAIPLLMHIHESVIGVNTLYALWSTSAEKHYGFFANQELEIVELVIPNREEYRTEKMIAYIERLIKTTMGDISIRFSDSTRGSGTPYCVVKLDKRNTWRKLATAALEV